MFDVDAHKAASLETSIEILDAIHQVAYGDEAVARRIWEAPTEAEALAIWERVTKNGLYPSTDFCWGTAGAQWAQALGIEA